MAVPVELRLPYHDKTFSTPGGSQLHDNEGSAQDPDAHNTYTVEQPSITRASVPGHQELVDDVLVDEADSDIEESHAANTTSERDRVRAAVFDAFVSSDLGQAALRSRPKLSAADEELSVRALVTKGTSEAIVKNPREYQLELFERAKEQNTICVLDTGSGKTLIAVLLLRWTIDKELEARVTGNQHKVSFFLCCSVALTFQQHSVLQTNLDHKILRLSGNDNPDRFGKEKWADIFAENKIIVCTADILIKCLSRGFVTVRLINLLIFDEAHHTKKNHPYARVIKDFYLAEKDITQRPRIFGMTASPVDSKEDPVEAASELETLLDCRIATASDMTLVQAYSPKEQLLVYQSAPTMEFESPFLQTLQHRYSHIAAFQEALTKSRRIAWHLGHWCADRYLIHAFSEERTLKYELSIQSLLRAGKARGSISELDTALAEFQVAIKYIREQGREAHERNTKQLYGLLKAPRSQSLSDDSSPSSRVVTPKVLALYRFLSADFERATSNLCMVFVDWKQTARMLHLLFQELKMQHMKSEYVVGSGKSEDANFSLRSQVLALSKFRDSDDPVNCLFATSVAEEGLDVPGCNLVIRFDMYKTMIQYIQSRGRARAKNSRFIHMIEKDNMVHRQLLHEVFQGAKQMKDFCAALPEDRQLQGNVGLENLLEREKTLRYYIVKSTGAKLSYGTAMQVLARFVSSVPMDHAGGEHPHPTYTCIRTVEGFVSEVILPTGAPLRSAIGLPRSKKTVAKHSAAFEACLILLQKKYLDEYLMPRFGKQLPAMRNALLATGINKFNTYHMQVKPSVWQNDRGAMPTQLWMTRVDLIGSGLEESYHPLLLLTRVAVPDFPQFSLYLTNGQPVSVVSSNFIRYGSLSVNEKLLRMLSSFTFCVFQDVFTKEYENDAGALSYWLCPARKSGDFTQHGPMMLDEAIDYSMLYEVTANPRGSQWTPGMPNASLVNKFMIDPWDGERKFFSSSIHPTLTQTDPVPTDAVRGKFMNTILDYSISLFKESRKKAKWVSGQPVIVAEKSPHVSRRNMLAAPSQKESEAGARTRVYLCPEPLRISVLRPEVARTCFMWSAIIHRFESYMIAVEGCAVIGVRCDVEHALAAFTKDSGHSEDHREDAPSVNFRSGMGENYERLEFLGDTFLKCATSISTFVLHPDQDEFESHVCRMLMLCNKNLYEVAVADDLKVYQYIRSQAFSRRLWYPEGLRLLKGKGIKNGEAKVMDHEPQSHSLSQKSIADVCEALIGASLTFANKADTWDMHTWDQVVSVVTKLVRSDDHSMQCWSDYWDTYQKHTPKYQTARRSASHKYLAEMVARENDYTFQSPRLAFIAFIHPSMPLMYEGLPNYQRFEFLGDALLDLAIVDFVFNKYPDKGPHWLTEHKMAVVSNRFLGSVCVNLGFHKHLRHNHAQLDTQIRTYATELEDAKAKAQQTQASDTARLRDYWTTVQDPPKCLPDIGEAYVGAMFIDSGFNFSTVTRFFDAHMRFYFEDMTIYDSYASNHPMTKLENLLSGSFGCRDHTIMVRECVGEDGREKNVAAGLVVHDRVVEGTLTHGTSSRYAKLRVAVKAEEVLNGLGLMEFRQQMGCHC